jgi:hypothetical protein
MPVNRRNRRQTPAFAVPPPLRAGLAIGSPTAAHTNQAGDHASGRRFYASRIDPTLLILMYCWNALGLIFY